METEEREAETTVVNFPLWLPITKCLLAGRCFSSAELRSDPLGPVRKAAEPSLTDRPLVTGSSAYAYTAVRKCPMDNTPSLPY